MYTTISINRVKSKGGGATHTITYKQNNILNRELKGVDVDEYRISEKDKKNFVRMIELSFRVHKNFVRNFEQNFGIFHKFVPKKISSQFLAKYL